MEDRRLHSLSALNSLEFSQDIYESRDARLRRHRFADPCALRRLRTRAFDVAIRRCVHDHIISIEQVPVPMIHFTTLCGIVASAQ